MLTIYLELTRPYRIFNFAKNKKQVPYSLEYTYIKNFQITKVFFFYCYFLLYDFFFFLSFFLYFSFAFVNLKVKPRAFWPFFIKYERHQDELPKLCIPSICIDYYTIWHLPF